MVKNEKSLKFRKTLKASGIIAGILLGCMFLFVLGVFINHKKQIRREWELLKSYDIGKTVMVDGQEVNYKVFNSEKTEHTLVLMPGLNVQNAALSFTPLAEKVNARVILINRPGYALSEDTGVDATSDFIVEFYRKTLKEIGVETSVILMPHSIAGQYAMYWAEKYPEEVSGMIALDIGSPENAIEEKYNHYDWFSTHLYNIAAKVGLHRLFMLDEATRDAEAEQLVKTGYFTEDLARASKILGMENAFPDFVVSESELEKTNAENTIKIRGENYRKLAKLFIAANQFDKDYYEKYFKKTALSSFGGDKKAMEEYLEFYKEYKNDNQKALQDENATFIEVPGPHAIWEYPTDKLAEAINSFIGNYRG